MGNSLLTGELINVKAYGYSKRRYTFSQKCLFGVKIAILSPELVLNLKDNATNSMTYLDSTPLKARIEAY